MKSLLIVLLAVNFGVFVNSQGNYQSTGATDEAVVKKKLELNKRSTRDELHLIASVYLRSLLKGMSRLS